MAKKKSPARSKSSSAHHAHHRHVYHHRLGMGFFALLALFGAFLYWFIKETGIMEEGNMQTFYFVVLLILFSLGGILYSSMQARK